MCEFIVFVVFSKCIGRITMTSSLFHYPEGTDFNTYNILDFTPLFYEEVVAKMTEDEKTKAADICGENRDCIFDLAITGRCACMASDICGENRDCIFDLAITGRCACMASDICGENRDCIFDLAITGRCACMASDICGENRDCIFDLAITGRCACMASDICGENRDCIFDLAITGRCACMASDICGENRDCIFDLAITGRCACMASVVSFCHMFTGIKQQYSIFIQSRTNQFSSTVSQNQSRHLTNVPFLKITSVLFLNDRCLDSTFFIVQIPCTFVGLLLYFPSNKIKTTSALL